MADSHSIRIVGLRSLPEIRCGDDLAALLRRAAQAEHQPLGRDVVLVIAQKIVSKAEGAVVDLRTVDPSAAAQEWAGQWGKDPRLIELILRQSRRIVKMDRGVLIAETQHGLVAANAGVDQSNVPGDDCATVLPADPDGSARRLREQLGCGAVIISDTFGRPWREGLVNVAIGVAGLAALEDHRGAPDRCGHILRGTVVAVADELAAAAGVVMRKAEGVPAALIFGFRWKSAPGSARDLMRSPERDLFR
jgi:coenzyme F420-0:L-glutamate ligase/coenzyme F420-1:gamma-L-glutamate ligase